MPGHSEAVLVVAFSPDGKQLATGSGDTTLRLWDLNTQLPRWECKVRGVRERVQGCNTCAALLAAPRTPQAQVPASHSPARRCATTQGHRNWVLCVAWAPDGSMVASGDMDGNIWLWDPKTGKPLGTCKGHSKWITSLVRGFEVGAGRAEVSCASCTCCGVSGVAIRRVCPHPHSHSAATLGPPRPTRAHQQAWEPAHKALPARRFVSGSKDQTLRIWDAATRRCIYTMSSHTMIVTCVRWGGEGLVYSASRDGCINVWDAAAGKLVRCLKGHGHWVNTLALSTEAVLRSGLFDHTGAAPQDPAEAMQASVCVSHTVLAGCGSGSGWWAHARPAS
jgi:ribosome assembly protein 4